MQAVWALRRSGTGHDMSDVPDPADPTVNPDFDPHGDPNVIEPFPDPQAPPTQPPDPQR